MRQEYVAGRLPGESAGHDPDGYRGDGEGGGRLEVIAVMPRELSAEDRARLASLLQADTVQDERDRLIR